VADPLAFPDAAIDEFEREAASRCSRLRGEMQSHLDIDNQLENNLVSVLPVVPGPKLETCSSIIDPFDGEGKKAHEGRVREDHSEKLGTTEQRARYRIRPGPARSHLVVRLCLWESSP